MMSTAEDNIRTLPALPPIGDVYAAIARTHPILQKQMPIIPGGGTERRAFCLSLRHADTNNPSCDYNFDRNTYHCKTCSAGGGVIELVLVSGRAENRKAAYKWLRDEGLVSPIDPMEWWKRVDVLYDYLDLNKQLVYQKGRTNKPKDFRLRAPDGIDRNGVTRWKPSVKGLSSIPYRWPELAKACAEGGIIFIVEGEKDVDTMRANGLIATTNFEGASQKWPIEWADHFKGAKLAIVIADNDEPGRRAALQRASIVARAVKSTRIILALPDVGEKGDVTDWFEAGGTVKGLLRLCKKADLVEPYIPPYSPEHLHALLSDMTDVGNGDWFSHIVGDKVRYVKNHQAWYCWDGTRWNPNEPVQGHVRVALDTMKLAAGDCGGEDATKLAEHAISTRASSKIRSMLELAEHHSQLTADDLDKQTYLLNCANGTLDLNTFELRAPDPNDNLTKTTHISYDPEATCPNFEALLHMCMDGDQELIDYFVQLAGGALEGRIGTRRLYFVHGPAGTGKSTVVKALEAAMGEYACSVDMTALCENRSRNSSAPSPELVRLKGMRLVTAAEASSAHRLDDARIKQLVGGDTIVARGLHEAPIEFKFMATLLLFGNDDPNVTADDSFWSKLKKIPFMHKIGSNDEGYFDREIVPELPGILALMVRGLKKYKGNKYRLHDPEAVIHATESYRESANPLSDFVEDCCELYDSKSGILHRDWRCSKAELRSAYQAFCIRNNLTKYALGEKKFASYLAHYNVEPVKSGSNRHWSGIRLNPEEVNRLTSTVEETDADF